MSKSQIEEGRNYDNHPALKAYIDRVGAEELNFRKFIIREYFDQPGGKRYYEQKALIRIMADGSVVCTQAEYAPTEKEAEAIRAIVTANDGKWPSSCSHWPQFADDLRRTLNVKLENWYPCLDLKREKVLWVQERKEDGGDKDYYPWSFWSDGKWRRMEPEGDLPFWKPKQRSSATRLMIHEGAKAARFVDYLVHGGLEPENPRAKKAKLADLHPWLEQLAVYEHWGMMGGALTPHRAAYDEVRRHNASEVVYVCDRDAPGEAALQKVSRAFGGSLIGVRFDARWPMGWDLADPLPEKLYEPDERNVLRYVGPSLEELMVPATWATRTGEPTGKKGRPHFALRREFMDEWNHSVTPEAFVNKRWPSRIYYKAAEFNNRVAPFSEVDDAARLLKRDDAGKVEVLHYSPALPSGVVAGPPRAFNTHQSSLIKPKQGDVKKWEDYLRRVFPVETDRIEVMRWCATLIARPAVKMFYGLLLVSEEQGVGKTTLGQNVLTPLLGKDNVSFPNESSITESQFNEWKAHKRLAVVNEIYAGDSSRAYNKLKDLITDRYVWVNRKNVPEYRVDNWCHIFACSNSMRALKLPDGDRRWLVPQVTEEKQDEKYWVEFNRWLETGGLPAIAWWAEQFVTKHGAVQMGAAAPDTRAKRTLIEETWSKGQQCVADWLDKAKESADKDKEKTPVIITDDALVELIRYKVWDGQRTDKLERPSTVRKMAKARGWFVAKEREFIGPGKGKARLIATRADLVLETPAKLRENKYAILDDGSQLVKF